MTNPVSPTDRVFLKHFSLMIGFLLLVMFALIGLALYLYSFNPPPHNPMQKADAEALPFADATFDVVLSTFGVMFTADQATCCRALMAAKSMLARMAA